jgi:hypothetical protein
MQRRETIITELCEIAYAVKVGGINAIVNLDGIVNLECFHCSRHRHVRVDSGQAVSAHCRDDSPAGHGGDMPKPRTCHTYTTWH